MSAAEYRATVAKPAKRSKYGSRKTVVDGITFHSEKEALRFATLKMLVKAGDYSDLRLQPRYELTSEGKHICWYIADFEYRDAITGETVTEDCKGVETETFKLKKKLFEAQYGRRIKLT